MVIPDYPNRCKGHYLGTEIDEKWWKRYRKDKMFARGNGEYWFDDAALYFRRYLTKQPIRIQFEKVFQVKIGKSHAGRWLFRPRVLKLIWKHNDLKLSSGFVLFKTSQETEAISQDIKQRFLNH